MRYRSWCIVFGITILLILVVFFRKTTVFNKIKVPDVVNKEDSRDAEGELFAIITNTEECLPAYLLETDYFGNKTFCNCHVYVTSFKKRCKEDLRFPHVHYYFEKGILMSKGCNIGYFRAKRSSNRYLYYIFMDDDAHLSYNTFTRREDVARKVPPFRIFTNFLEEYRPARCGPDYQGWNMVGDMLNHWHGLCNRFQTPRVFSVSHFDMCLHAIHRDASDFVLPFQAELDYQSFWLPIVKVSLAFFIYFRGHTIYFPEVKLFNGKHRYIAPGHEHLVINKTIRREMVESIRRKTPLKYRKHPFFAEAMRYRMLDISHVLCKDPVPARTPILPFTNVNYRNISGFTA